MLILAGIESIFFTAAGMGLCFGFVLETVLIIVGFVFVIAVFVIAEQCLHSLRAFSASHSTPPVSRLGVHKELEGDKAGMADPN